MYAVLAVVFYISCKLMVEALPLRKHRAPSCREEGRDCPVSFCGPPWGHTYLNSPVTRIIVDTMMAMAVQGHEIPLVEVTGERIGLRAQQVCAWQISTCATTRKTAKGDFTSHRRFWASSQAASSSSHVHEVFYFLADITDHHCHGINPSPASQKDLNLSAQPDPRLNEDFNQA